MVRLYRGETPVEELQREFTDELKTMLKEAALKVGCSVEELKYRVSNDGIVEIQRMTLEEMGLAEKKLAAGKRERIIRESRN